MKGRSALAVIGLCLASSVNAADWQKIAEIDEVGSYLAVDLESIAASGKLRKAWFRWTYNNTRAKPVPSGAEIAGNATYVRSLNLVYFNCAERTSGNIKTIYHDLQGEVVGGHSVQPKDAYFDEPAPDTLGEIMLATVCKVSLKSAKGEPP